MPQFNFWKWFQTPGEFLNLVQPLTSWHWSGIPDKEKDSFKIKKRSVCLLLKSIFLCKQERNYQWMKIFWIMDSSLMWGKELAQPFLKLNILLRAFHCYQNSKNEMCEQLYSEFLDYTGLSDNQLDSVLQYKWWWAIAFW